MGTIHLVLLVGAASLMSFSTTVILFMRLQGRERQFQARVASVIAVHSRVKVAETVQRKVSRQTNASLVSRIFGLAGYKRDEPYLYSIKWWIVALVAIAPARLACWILAGMIGDAALYCTPVAWLFICRSVFKTLELRYLSKVLMQFPDALASIVRSVRVGIPVNVAIQSVAEESPPETSREFVRATETLAIGGSVEDAVATMAEHARITEYRFFATALSLQSQTGGGLTETLENLADVIRKRVAMRARGKALSSEAKTSAAILAALPVVTGFGLVFVSPAYVQVLVFDPGGRKLLAAAVGLLVVGFLIMRQMIRKSLA